MVHAVIAGHEVDTDVQTVLTRLRTAQPEPVRTHYVVAEGRRFPVIQALSLVTGIDRGEVQSQQARRLFRRLGLTTGRIGQDPAPAEPVAVREAPPPARRKPRTRRQGAAMLRPFRGQWVAVDADWSEVLYAGVSPYEVVAWLRANRVRGSIFRVPLDPSVDPPRDIS